MDYLVPNETTADPLGQALVPVTVSIHGGPGTMPSAVSAFTVSRKKDGAPGSRTSSGKWWSWDVNPVEHQLSGWVEAG